MIHVFDRIQDIMGGNAGYYDLVGTNPASQFCDIINEGYVLASDGTVQPYKSLF